MNIDLLDPDGVFVLQSTSNTQNVAGDMIDGKCVLMLQALALLLKEVIVVKGSSSTCYLLFYPGVKRTKFINRMKQLEQLFLLLYIQSL